eukprot:2650176-Alexandrium_andersonii.AAC.1
MRTQTRAQGPRYRKPRAPAVPPPPFPEREACPRATAVRIQKLKHLGAIVNAAFVHARPFVARGFRPGLPEDYVDG